MRITSITYLIGALALFALAACSGDVTDVQQGDETSQEQRGLTHITFTASLEQPASRVTYSPGVGALTRHWDTSEQLGVYIKQTDGNIVRAGSISSTGETTDVSREFSGDVTTLQAGETYIYMHPDLGGTAGEAATATIGFSSQSGVLGSTAHLQGLIPMVWRGGNSLGEMQGYVVHLVLTFNEDPGTITSVTLQTMKQDAADRIFPKAFQTALLGSEANSVLDSRKAGTAIDSDDYTDAITLSVSGAATQDGDVWRTEAFLASASIKNLDVFRTKYNVKVVGSNGTFCSDLKSFPGQSSASSSTGLPMLANGKSYRLTAKMSKGYAPTIVSEQFKVNSLLGMWNQYGKAYDPQGLVVTDEEQWPTPLRTNKTAIQSKVTSQTYAGTPSWLGPAAGSLYATGQTDLKQENVSFNNILITANTEVFFTIVSEFGWNQNLLGYYHYPTANEGSVSSSSVTKNIIFADVSKPGHEPFRTAGLPANNVGRDEDAPIQEFETVRLLYTDADGYTSTTFPAGTTIGFWMMIDPQANDIPEDHTGYAPRTYDLMRWDQWRLFTNSAWNAENTLANGAKVNWPSTGYTNSNFFASGDVCNDGTPIPGLAIYGVKDNGINTYSYAYGAMIFMVSTAVPTAMQTQNRASFNIGTGSSLVIAK